MTDKNVLEDSLKSLADAIEAKNKKVTKEKKPRKKAKGKND